MAVGLLFVTFSGKLSSRRASLAKALHMNSSTVYSPRKRAQLRGEAQWGCARWTPGPQASSLTHATSTLKPDQHILMPAIRHLNVRIFIHSVALGHRF